MKGNSHVSRLAGSLGAELSETQDVADRVTGHHIDIVFDSGTLSDNTGAALLSW